MSAAPDGSAIELPADLGIEGAHALYAALAPRLDAAAALILDGARVSRAHAAGLQVLAAFVRTRAAAGRATHWRDPSPALRKGAASLGLQGALALPAAADTR